MVLREALALGRHFLGDGALPGALLSLLATMRRRRADDGPLELADVLATVSERSGLPLSLLDERERLDVDALRAFFSRRVIGQPEAVECVVERVALLKAGLTDPTRPQAVLLFVGPTGTGKTEIAKALAEYLFGSGDRMIRLDLSRVPEPRQRAPDARRATTTSAATRRWWAGSAASRSRSCCSTSSRRPTRACGTCSCRCSTTGG